MHTENSKGGVERTELHTCTNLWICRLTSPWEGMDDKPFSSSLVITLCAQPRAVARSSHMLIPILPLPFARVIRGVTTVTSRKGLEKKG